MYAVFVIAAILLSVSPMHARTLLGALQSTTPGHQLSPENSAAKPHIAAARTQAHPAHQSEAFQAGTQTTAAPRQVQAPAIRAAAPSLLEHSPNAP
jgi:Tfp pilus assembly protein PilV